MNDEINAELEVLCERKVFINFCGTEGEDVEIPVRVTSGFFVQVIGELESYLASDETLYGERNLTVILVDEDPGDGFVSQKRMTVRLDVDNYAQLLLSALRNHASVVKDTL